MSTDTKKIDLILGLLYNSICVQLIRDIIMRYIFAIVVVLLTGCSTINQIASTCPGLRPYDPQMCRGEFFQQLPNFENEAIIRRQRGEVW